MKVKWIPSFCGTKKLAGKREKALALDEEHEPYIRAKRNSKNLPDGWDDTKIIKREKTWKKTSWSKNTNGKIEELFTLG